MSKTNHNAIMALFFSTENLLRVVTAEDAEKMFLVNIKGSGSPPVPFGALNSEWRKLLAKMQAGDQLWEFRHKCPDGSVFHGLKLLRDNRVVDTIIGSASQPSP